MTKIPKMVCFRGPNESGLQSTMPNEDKESAEKPDVENAKHTSSTCAIR